MVMRLDVAPEAFQDYCPKRQRRFVLIAAILASSMGFIDGTIVAIAIPAIRAGLDASLADVQWINNAYMLTLSALILVGGAAGDKYGLRWIFSVGIVVFMATSAACALAWSPDALIVARAFKGAGAALMVPASLAIISKTYPKAERGRAIGIWAASSALTTAIGPILGGVLLSLGGADAWRLIFAINLPIGAIPLFLLLFRVPPDRPVSNAALDWQGALLATAALGVIAWAMTGPEGKGVPALSHVVTYGLAGAVLLALFIWAERRSAEPMMPLRLFAVGDFSAANLITFFLYFALSAVLFYLPMTLITGWGLDETRVSLVFVPLTVAVALGSGPVGALAARTGTGPLIGTGCAIVALAYGLLAYGIGWQAFWLHVFACMCLMGVGMALVVAPLSTAVMGAVDDADAGAASGINNAVSRVAGLVAVAGMGGVAAAAYVFAGGGASFGEPVANGGAGHVAATDAAFAALAWVTAALCLVASVIAFVWLPRGPVADSEEAG